MVLITMLGCVLNSSLCIPIVKLPRILLYISLISCEC